MNALSKLLLSAAVVAIFFLSFAYQAGAVAPGPKISELSAGNKGNKHNLSAKAWEYGTIVYDPIAKFIKINPNLYKATNDPTGNPRGQEICIFCHTPHNANVEGGAPLWNRAFSTQTFSRYSSNTLQIRVNPAAKSAAGYDDTSVPKWEPDGSSKLCLSCHDGVSSLGNVLRGGPIAMSNGDVISSDTAVSWASFNPSNTNKMKFGHHPVSFAFDATVVPLINAGRLPTSQVQLPSLPQVKLRNGKMQCTTCHDAHQNQSNDDECYDGTGDCTAPFTRKKAPFWVYGVSGTSNAAGDQQTVCLECHPMLPIPSWTP